MQNMVLNLPWYFYLLMEKPLGHLCNQKKPIHISSMWHVMPEKTKKRLIIANNNLYLLKSASTDLKIQIQLKLINTKRWGIFIVTTWLEGWLTKPKETYFHMQHGTKTVSAFLTADGEAFYSLLSILVSWLSCNTVQHENTYFCILWKAKKGLSINNNHIYHQCLSH